MALARGYAMARHQLALVNFRINSTKNYDLWPFVNLGILMHSISVLVDCELCMLGF